MEALDDIDVPCILQWEMLWLSTPPSLNSDVSNDGEILETLHETVNMTFKSAYVLPSRSEVCFEPGWCCLLSAAVSSLLELRDLF